MSNGKYAIQVIYIDGKTDGKDSFQIYENSGYPFTGDGIHIIQWSGLAMTSLMCMAMMVVLLSKKKGKFQK